MSMMSRPKWPFLLMCVFDDVRHVEFRGLTDIQRTPGFGASHIDRLFLFLRFYFKSLFLHFLIVL